MSTEVQTVVEIPDKTDTNSDNRDPFNRKSTSLSLINKKQKVDEGKHCSFRYCRKRTHRGCHVDKYLPVHKRRKKDQSIPPTKFLLGGNIRDPLNLNSLQDEEVSRRLNAVTPETSPMPTPQWKKGEVEVLLPPNIHDPLNLEGREEDDSQGPARKCRKKNKKKKNKHHNDSKSDESKTEETLEISEKPEIEAPPAEQLPQESQEPKLEEKPKELKVVETKPLSLEIIGAKKNKSGSTRKSTDKIVSPVVPQPGAWNAPRRKMPPQQSLQSAPNRPTPKFKEHNKRFQYGNYSRYYGYRNVGCDTDPRLKLLELRQELFEGKEVLDIGCNTGQVTVAVARILGASRVVGLDLDSKLVEIAKSNLRHHLRVGAPPSRPSPLFPISMPLVYGPLPASPHTHAPPHNSFPHNISFLQGNYILSNDALLQMEKPQFDTILCLSVTKWFHLNWGDDGLKRAFRRMYAQLRPGGCLLLEPQHWQSYHKKKNITETTWKNFKTIKLYPEKFTQFLLSEVGFSKCELLGAPVHSSKGFQRPIWIYFKSNENNKENVKEKPVDETNCSVLTDSGENLKVDSNIELKENSTNENETKPQETQNENRENKLINDNEEKTSSTCEKKRKLSCDSLDNVSAKSDCIETQTTEGNHRNSDNVVQKNQKLM